MATICKKCNGIIPDVVFDGDNRNACEQHHHPKLDVRYEKCCQKAIQSERERIESRIEQWKKDVLDTERNQDKKYADGALIAISMISKIVGE